MKTYTVTLSEGALAFARELVQSKLAVTIENVEHVADFKRAILAAVEFDDKGMDPALETHARD